MRNSALRNISFIVALFDENVISLDDFQIIAHYNEKERKKRIDRRLESGLNDQRFNAISPTLARQLPKTHYHQRKK